MRRALVAVAAAAMAACGGGETVDATRASVTTTTATTVSTTIVPATTTTTTTTPPPPPAGAMPATALAATHDGRVVVLDTTSGDVVRVLDDRYSDLDTAPPEGGHWAVIEIVPVHGSTSVYVETCCEPAGGDIRRYTTDGAVVGESVNSGYGPSVAPRGELAYGMYTIGLALGSSRQPRIVERSEQDPSSFFERTSWVGDEAVAYVVARHDGRETTAQILRHDLGVGTLDGDAILAELDEAPIDLVTRGDGALVWVGSAGAAHVLDPVTGAELETVDLGGPVIDVAYDASGTWLLVVGEGGDLRWFGEGTSGTIPGRFTAAGW